MFCVLFNIHTMYCLNNQILIALMNLIYLFIVFFFEKEKEVTSLTCDNLVLRTGLIM